MTKEEDLVIPKLTEEQVYPEVVSPKKTASVSYVNSLIKKLKAKKKYYVQVRTYKTVSGKKYYSKWSKKKTVKTK